MAAYLAMGAAVAFTSCSNDDVLDNSVIETPVESGVQEIVLQLANAGDGLTTRAGRPLESSEAKQDVEAVQVFVCNSTTKQIVYTTKITDWMTDGNGIKDYANGREKTIQLLGEDKLSADNYVIYAIGYGEASKNSETSDFTNLNEITSLEKGGTFPENKVLTLTEGKVGEEIFAGSLSLEVEEKKGFKANVVLNRQVAGSFGYVKDIPYSEGATALQLVASNKSNSLVLGNFANDDHGSANIASPKYVVNSVNGDEATTQVIYTITLSDWFKKVEDTNDDGIIDAGENWKGDAKKYKNGSAFAGSFIIPFMKATNATFELQMINGSNKHVLRTWTVSLPSSGDGQVGQKVTYWNGTAFTKNATTETASVYSVVRNHLYGIGARPSANPEDPETDPEDKPEPLNTKQDLTLRVNDNWEVIHQMEID